MNSRRRVKYWRGAIFLSAYSPGSEHLEWENSARKLVTWTCPCTMPQRAPVETYVSVSEMGDALPSHRREFCAYTSAEEHRLGRTTAQRNAATEEAEPRSLRRGAARACYSGGTAKRSGGTQRNSSLGSGSLRPSLPKDAR